MPVSLRTGGDTRHAQPKSACTFLSATARASSEHSFRVQAVEAEHTEGSLVALSQTVPLGMGGLRRSVQTCPFARRTLDHGRRTLHDDSFYGRERHGKLFIAAYIFLRFCRIRSTTTWLVLAAGFILEYLAELLLIFAFAPDPFRGVEGDGDGDGLAARVRQFPFVSYPCTLKVMCLVSSSSDAFFGPRSCRPQPRGSRREAVPRKDTRQDCGSYASWRSGSLFNFCTGVV